MSRNLKNKWELFQKNLRYFRKQKGISQTDMAARLDVKPGTISNYESGVSSPDLDTFVQIVHLLGVSPSRLLGLEEYYAEENIKIIEKPTRLLESKECQACELRERIISQQEKTISALEARIRDIERYSNNINNHQ